MTKKSRIAQMRLLRMRLLRDIENYTKAIAALENVEAKARENAESKAKKRRKK